MRRDGDPTFFFSGTRRDVITGAETPLLMPEASSLDFMAGGGEMGGLMRSHDWAGTPLGPVAHWPQSLRTSVSTCLECAFPILLWWGSDLVMLYNDEYRVILGSEKHPFALGAKGRHVFPELWDVIGPMLSQVMSQGQATRSRDLLLVMNRHGYDEETYFSFSYSPIRDETGGIAGVFTPVFETTDRVIGERRLRTLRDLAARTRPSVLSEACHAAADTLADNPHDIPFALLYRLDHELGRASLLFAAGVQAGALSAPQEITLSIDDQPGIWPLAEAARRGEAVLIDDLSRRFAHIPAGAWPIPPHSALLTPISLPGADRPIAVMVAAISPRRALDRDHRSFFDLVSRQVGQTLAESFAFEEEHRRLEALAEIDRAKTLFFSNVSHEFRTPLTLMLGPLEALLSADQAALPPDMREMVALAHTNSQRLLRLVNSLLDFSRLEAGRMRAIFEPVDLAEYTAELASNFRSATQRAGLDLVIDAPPLPSPVYVDREMWEKIVLNLMSNAFKFTLKGRIEVRVRASADGGSAQVSVRDTGVGIAPAELSHVFERFHRAPDVKGRSIEGSGIGLALVQGLARLQGGDIAVASQIGVGSEFTVTLPFGVDHLPASPDREQVGLSLAGGRGFADEALSWLPSAPRDLEAASAADGATGAVGRGLRVLVADDNADMGAYIRRLLQDRGYQAEVVGDGAAALAIAAGYHPDLILSDVMMPGIDGFELLGRLRADERTRDIPVLLVSARAGEEATIEGLAAGADDYIVKPFSARELFARVESAIRLAKSRRLAADARQEEHVRIRRLFEQAPGFITILRGPDHVFEFANESYCAMVGRRDLIGRSVLEAFPELGGQGFYELLDQVYRSGERFVGRAMPIAFREDAQSEPRALFLDFIYEPVTDGAGRVSGIFVEGYDVTERRRHEEHLHLLIDELNHRVKNTLAIVQGVAQQTFRGAGVPPERLAAFEGRLRALAAAHTLLTRANWVSADLGAMMTAALEAHGGLNRRYRLDGPPVALEPKAAVTLAMAIHELCTNAAKYGALSVPEGTVSITWRKQPDSAGVLHIRWEENAGPPVVSRGRRGFGTRMIEHALAADLRGDVSMNWRTAGLVCDIHARLTPTVEEGARHGAQV